MPSFDPLDDSDLPPLADPYSEPELAVCLLLEDREGAADAALRLRGRERDLTVGRLGRLVVLRQERAEIPDRDRLVRELEDPGAQVAVGFPGEREYLSFTVTWEGGSDALPGVLDSYFAAPSYLYLRAPWVPAAVAPALTGAEVRNREILRELLEPPAPEDLEAYANQFLSLASAGDSAGLKGLWDRQLEQLQRRSAAQADRVRARHPEAPQELFDRFLASTLAGGAQPGELAPSGGAPVPPDPVEATGAALGELLGGMRLEWSPERAVPRIVEPAHAYSTMLAGDRGEGRLDALAFTDPLHGLPALLQFLADHGAHGIAYEMDSSQL